MGKFQVLRKFLRDGKWVVIVLLTPNPYEPPTDPARAAARQPPKQPAETNRLEICPQCASDLVYPIENSWSELPNDMWEIGLRCPNCQHRRVINCDQAAVERFDSILNDGTDAVIMELERRAHENQAEETERFVLALRVNAILPEDFGRP